MRRGFVISLLLGQLFKLEVGARRIETQLIDGIYVKKPLSERQIREADFVALVEGNLERIVAYFEQISSQMLTLVDGGRENDVLIHPLRIQISDIENGIEKINQEFIQRKEEFGSIENYEIESQVDLENILESVEKMKKFATFAGKKNFAKF